MLTHIGALVGCYCGNPRDAQHDAQIVADGRECLRFAATIQLSRQMRSGVRWLYKPNVVSVRTFIAALRKPTFVQRVLDVPVARAGGSQLARLVVVSNRVSLPDDSVKRAGGLEVALRPALQKNGGVWLGWSGKVASGSELQTRSVCDKNIRYVVTDLSKESFEEYYNGFANRVLWPTLHYRLDLAEFAHRDLSGYFKVNDHFASELEQIIERDDLIWVHDYHLIPIADALRRRGHFNPIGFFLHVPLPPPEILTSLPNHEKLIPLLTQYDVVGFQTAGDVQNFVRYLVSQCNPRRQPRVFGTAAGQVTVSVSGRETLVDSFPVGIEPGLFAALARRHEQPSLVKDLIASLGGRNLVIGVDRLDYSKGLLQRLDAFKIFLANHSEWHGKLTYLQITPTNRVEIPEYAELQRALEAAAGRINGRYGEVSWTPIRYVNRAYSRPTLAGLYRTARVGLVTPLRDGMNLVAKEYVAAQDPDDPGVLILSRFAGAANRLQSALLVNPSDAESVANALLQALTMPLEERRARHNDLYAAICDYDVHRWQREFLAALGDRKRDQNFKMDASDGVLAKRQTGGEQQVPIEKIASLVQ